MRRRPEAYHAKVQAHDAAAAEGAAQPHDGGSGPASIHDIVTLKQAGLSERLQYDAYERRSGLVRLLPPGTTADVVGGGATIDLVAAASELWTVESIHPDRVVARWIGEGLTIRKTIGIGGGRLDPTLIVEAELVNGADRPLEAVFGIEFALMLLGGGHNPAAFHDVDGRRLPHDERAEAESVDRLTSGNDQIGVALETILDAPATAWIAPIETVSNSEGGFELVYQGSSVVLVRPISLTPGARTTMRVVQHVTVAADAFSAERPEAAAGGEPAVETAHTVAAAPGT
jgi:alpha-amylase